MARETWTDERLDDLAARVDKGFERVDRKFDALQAEMNARFDSMHRTMIIGFVTLCASIVASLIGVAFAA